MMSILLRPPKDSLSPSKASLVTSAFANAAAAAVSTQLGVELGVKWPNDLVVNAGQVPELAASGERRVDPGYRKVAGILTESVISEARVDALVVGMGLNTGWPEVPQELASVATSLNLLSGTEVDRAVLARGILEGFEERYAALLVAGGASRVLDEVRRRSATLGQEVRVEFVEDDLEGRAVDLDEEGHLVVRDGHGVHHVVSVGDVVHLRPAGA